MKKGVQAVVLFFLSFALVACNSGGGLEEVKEARQVVKAKRDVLAVLTSLDEEVGLDFSFRQSTAFFWNVGEGDEQKLVEGKRVKARDISPEQDRTADFFAQNGFVAVSQNTEQSDESWKKGYQDEDMVCLVNGTPDDDSGLLNLFVSCGIVSE